ncbi:MAG: GDP-L-fucose synthase [Gammaproteobacteria bacterium]|nr:GDP-L-fucose synthase [Gammaproteobacteria bacterium]
MDAASQKIFLAGHKGMVGSSILRNLKSLGYRNIITSTREELDLTQQSEVNSFFQNKEFDQVYMAAARVGGIYANNTYPAQFIYENLMIEANVIHSAYISGVKKLLFLGSSCIYPKNSKQPMIENMLLTGILEPTNEPYAISKIAGIKLCESYNREYGTDFRSIMPTNLYGPGDNFHPENSHVIASLIHRFHNAKLDEKSNVSVWGTGKPFREFLHVDDMASAAIHVMNLEKSEYLKNTEPQLSHINIGSGKEYTISDLAMLIAETVNFKGNIKFDKDKPDGTPRKLIDSTLLRSMGWEPQLDLRKGLRDTYNWYLENIV